MIMADTHALLWWATGDRRQLSSRAHKALQTELKGGRIVVSSISAWELAMLVQRGRLSLSMDVSGWLKTLMQIEAIHFVPVDNDIALQSVALPGDFHQDPADRIIVATARHLSIPLVSADEKIRSYPHLKVVW